MRLTYTNKHVFASDWDALVKKVEPMRAHSDFWNEEKASLEVGNKSKRLTITMVMGMNGLKVVASLPWYASKKDAKRLEKYINDAVKQVIAERGQDVQS